MKLGLTYHTSFDFNRSREAYQEGFELWQHAVKNKTTAFPPQTLRIGGDEPVTLDPTRSNDGTSARILNQLFSGLITLGPEMEVLPDIAESWEVTSGGLKYIFHLRDDVVWRDGQPVTATDFEYAWKRVLDPATQSTNASLLYDVKNAQAFHQGQITDPEQVGVRSLDDHTLMVELEGPVGYFLYLLSHNATFALPRHVVETYGDRWTEMQHLVTNGPYRLEGWRHGERLSFKRNPLYHGQFNGNADQIESFIGMQFSTALELYKQDQLDVLGYALPSNVHAVYSRHADDFFTWPVLSTQYVVFDPSQAPFNDRRVRRAFVMAIDREWLTNELSGGSSFPAKGGFIPPGMPGHSPNIGLPHDPKQARQLLAEAGYPNGDGFPPITTLVNSSDALQWDLLLQRWHTVLGVESTCEVMGWGAYLERLRAQLPPIFLIGWGADYPDPDNFLRLGLASYSQGKWRNEAYTERVEKARRISNQEERIELYRQADRILIEEAMILPLNYLPIVLLLKPWVKRFPITPQGSPFWKDVIIEPH
jgi:oligopeptide transport system substrate-binding protein